MKVTVDSNNCLIQAGGTINSFTCIIPYNPNTVIPILRAGVYLPNIEVLGYGFAKPSVGITKISIPLSLNNVLPSQSAQTGGLPISILGSGFPLSLNEGLSVSMCDKAATILSVSNINITILSTPCINALNQIISVNYNGLTQTIQYNYLSGQYHIITNLNPKSASPVLKGYI